MSRMEAHLGILFPSWQCDLRTLFAYKHQDYVFTCHTPWWSHGPAFLPDLYYFRLPDVHPGFRC